MLSFLSLQTFVYLFAPICGHIRESDFMQNTRLENGRRVWQALWEFRHPDIECFTAQVSEATQNSGPPMCPHPCQRWMAGRPPKSFHVSSPNAIQQHVLNNNNSIKIQLNKDQLNNSSIEQKYNQTISN